MSCLRAAPRICRRNESETDAEEQRTLIDGESNQSTIVCVGYARLPQSFSPLGASVVLVEMEVDVVEEKVVGITVAGFATKASDVLADTLVGQPLQADDFAVSVREFQRRYVGAPQKAICTAVMNAFESYQRYLRQAGREFFPLPRGYEDENRR